MAGQFAPLNGATFAPGTVTVKSYKVVQHLEGGIVADILARDGDLVEQGQPLLVLDDTQPSASLEIATTQYTALRAKEARLVAERDGLDQITYPKGFSTQDARTQQEVNAQNEIFAARKAANEGRAEILKQRINQLQNQVMGMQALRRSKEQLAASYEDELRDAQALLAQGFPKRPD